VNPYQPPPGQQPPPYGAPPGAHPGAYPGQQPGYGYGAPQAPVSVDGIVSISKVAIALLGLRAALPVVLRGLGMAGARIGSQGVIDAIRLVATLGAIIVYLIWFARAYGWARVMRGGTQYSTGLAVGGWFIPFANFVLPYLALRDLWRRVMNDAGGLVALWWAGYVVAFVIQTMYSMAASGVPLGGLGAIWNAMGWLGTLAQIVGYGLLAMLVQKVTERIATGR
jgi:hypothetical protein